jgi:antitoxin HicB
MVRSRRFLRHGRPERIAVAPDANSHRGGFAGGSPQRYDATMARRKPVVAAEHTYNILLQPEPEGGYTVTCPSLPGLVTYGETLEEARTMAVEAVAAYLESLQLDDEPIPESDVVEPRPLIEPVRVRLGHG